MEDEHYIPSDAAKTFGHCKIDWLITDFCLHTTPKYWIIRSPDFEVNVPQETKWCFTIEPISDITNYMASLKLSRSSNDSGPKSVSVNLRAQFTGSGPKHINLGDKLFTFKNGDAHCISLETIAHLYKELKPFESETLTIVCEMIIYGDRLDERFPECLDPEINLLSDNLMNLYKSKEYYDTKLVFSDGIILAHRAILSARSTVLNDIIYKILNESDAEGEDKDECCMVIHLPEKLDYKGMKITVAYLYSGDLKHVLEEPSNFIYDCVQFLGRDEIVDYYVPDMLTLRSSVDVHQFKYEMFLPNFSREWDYLLSLVCDIDDCGSMYQLRLYPEKHKQTDWFNFYTQVSIKPTVARLEFAVADTHNCLFFKTKFLIRFGEDQHANTKYDKILIGRSMKTCPEESNFKIIINISLSTLETNSHIDQQIINFHDCFNENIYLAYLSVELGDLLMNDYTDLLVCNNEHYFAVHKCIVACRSQFFTDKLKTLKGDEIIEVSNMGVRTFRILLCYLYTGDTILTHDIDDTMGLYKAAITINLPSLKSYCSDKLMFKIVLNEIVACRVMKIAEDHEDKDLRERIINYWFNKNIIYPHIYQSPDFEDARACIHC